jgi:hypothetical protein
MSELARWTQRVTRQGLPSQYPEQAPWVLNRPISPPLTPPASPWGTGGGRVVYVPSPGAVSRRRRRALRPLHLRRHPSIRTRAHRSAHSGHPAHLPSSAAQQHAGGGGWGLGDAFGAYRTRLALAEEKGLGRETSPSGVGHRPVSRDMAQRVVACGQPFARHTIV